jgi:hypothetical protein
MVKRAQDLWRALLGVERLLQRFGDENTFKLWSKTGQKGKLWSKTGQKGKLCSKTGQKRLSNCRIPITAFEVKAGREGAF